MIKAGLVYLPTRGNGDCAIHAILGKWNGSEIFCEDVGQQRLQLKIAMQQQPRRLIISQLMTVGIQDLVMSGKNLNKSLCIKKLRQKYQQMLIDNQEIQPVMWQAVEEELIKYPAILEYIKEHHTLQKDTKNYKVFRERFFSALLSNDGLLYGLLKSVPALDNAFQAYNTLTNNQFDWGSSISSQAMSEYAAFISIPRTWLLPSELAIIAHVFCRHVIYFPALNAEPMNFNSEAKDCVIMRFNGINHFEQMCTKAEYENLLLKFPVLNTPGTQKFSSDVNAIMQQLDSSEIFDKPNVSFSENSVFPTIHSAISNLPKSNHPDTYKMSHLLAAGTRGTVYQLLVLLERLLNFLRNKIDFEATVEAEDSGNLDDIGIVIKDKNQNVASIEAYQIKYYKENIDIHDFLQKEPDPTKKEDKKTKKMHIGKFFDGWLALRKNYKTLQEKNLQCILYSNTVLDAQLVKLIKNHKLNENFITEINDIQISWPNRNSQAKANLFDKLFELAFTYLQDKKLHADVSQKNKNEQKLLFQKFLRSFEIRGNQPNIEALIKVIQKDLTTILNEPSEQIFLCLYYALQEWFLRPYSTQRVPKITRQVMGELLANSLTQSRDVMLLQGRSEAANAHLSYVCDNRTIPRDESILLSQALKKSGVVMVVGEKGIGKSGLVKQELEKYHPAEYLLLSAADLVREKKLRGTLLDVFTRTAYIKMMIIDGAELLLTLPAEELKKFLASLKSIGRTVVLTLTTEAFQAPIFEASKSQVIMLGPLPANQVVKYFTELIAYKNIESLIKLASFPFYLTVIMQFIKQENSEKMHDMMKSKIDLDRQLMQWLVHGQRRDEVSTRRLAWQQLSVKIASISNGLSSSFKLPSTLLGIGLLVSDRILLEENGLYRFCHDLLFEHGLIEFWSQKWQIAFVEGTTETFWLELSKTMKVFGAEKILDKWFLSYKSQLINDWDVCVNVLSKTSYFEHLIGVSILINDTVLLEHCLKLHKVQLNKVLPQVADYFSTTYILLTIECNAPESLALLLRYGANPHHPLAGNLRTFRYDHYTTAHYEKKDGNDSDSVVSDETESNVTSESEEGYSDDYGSDDDSGFSAHSRVFSSIEETLHPVDQFVQNPNKYWFADFDESLGECDDEGEWIENPAYQSPPNYNIYYIHQAVIQDRSKCLMHLIEAYQKYQTPEVIDLGNEYQETPLHIAVLHKAYSCVQLLCEENAEINFLDSWGETALHNAAYIGDLKLIEILLKNDANPNVTNSMGLSSFHIALTHFDNAIAKIFLEHGADLSLAPFELLFNSNDSMTIADLLDEMAENKQTEMEEFVIELVKLLIDGEDEKTQDQVKGVEELMSLISHRAALSEYFPGFDYTDDETKLDYILDSGFDSDDLNIAYILEDIDRIGNVLESQTFASLKKELFEEWLGSANKKGYKNLKQYAQEKDQELLSLIGSENESDDEKSSQSDDSVVHHGHRKSGLFSHSHITAEKNSKRDSRITGSSLDM